MPVRVTQAKNIEYALHVVKALKQSSCRPKLILTGPPDPHDANSMAYFRSLQKLRRELKVEREMRFVFESGPKPDEAYFIDLHIVGDLFRVSDIMFMPSHREGFGMPVLEAGLVGIPVVSTQAVPAVNEIGGRDVILFNPDLDDPNAVAQKLLDWTAQSATHRLRRRVRQNYTWQSIFYRQIEPLFQSSR
jgi:glycosyltransferase involved in cell wall biosynthesis